MAINLLMLMQPLDGASADSHELDAASGGQGTMSRPQCPEITAGLWSRFTFGWMSGLVAEGYRAPLTLKQVSGRSLMCCCITDFAWTEKLFEVTLMLVQFTLRMLVLQCHECITA